MNITNASNNQIEQIKGTEGRGFQTVLYNALDKQVYDYSLLIFPEHILFKARNFVQNNKLSNEQYQLLSKFLKEFNIDMTKNGWRYEERK